jgi:hypothetical protein
MNEYGQARRSTCLERKKGNSKIRLYPKSKPFEPAVAMCRATNGQLLTNNDQVLSIWKEYFEQHLNECSEEDPHARENDVIIDLPNRDKIVEAIKYMKDNKAAGLDSIATELLKSGGPSLVNSINEMIQQVWIGETLLESWTEGLLCPVHKKRDKLTEYDTITRHEIYVIMAELDIHTKLIRLTKATLTTVKCCVKIQNDCSDPFKTRQGLRQGHVLSTTGNIFNKQTQLLA